MTESLEEGRQLLELRGRDWAGLPLRRRRALVQRAFRYWRSRGFPYFQLSERQIRSEFRHLKTIEPSAAFRNGGLHGSIAGLRIANSFQPQMWSVRVSRYRSPMDVFQDDTLLRQALMRAWSIWPDRFGVNASCLRRMLKTFPGTASVSNFRPTLVRAVVDRFSPAGGTVVDFAAGYGGRLVGCLSLDRDYVGIEPCDEQVKGLSRTIAALSEHTSGPPSATIRHGCAEDILPALSTESADLVLSSPPFHDWEKYSEQPTQSYLRYPSYETWLRCFLGQAVRQSCRVLRRGGRLVLNVSRQYRRPGEDEVQHLAVQSGLELEASLPLLLARVPYLHPRGAGPFKAEVLLVFKKS
jgi:SAM-dependent methyltransferase